MELDATFTSRCLCGASLPRCVTDVFVAALVARSLHSYNDARPYALPLQLSRLVNDGEARARRGEAAADGGGSGAADVERAASAREHGSRGLDASSVTSTLQRIGNWTRDVTSSAPAEGLRRVGSGLQLW